MPFAIAELIDPGFMGDRALDPVRIAASIAILTHAMGPVARSELVIVGILVHIVLCLAFGAIYGAANNSFRARTRGRPDFQIAFGAMFGLAVWLLDFRIVAPIVYPWLIVTSHLRQAALHSVFFGVPLGISLSAFERNALDTSNNADAPNPA